MPTLIIFCLLAGFFLFARLYPIWPRRFQGCDAYNIMLCAQALRRRRKLPIRLPEELFLLEDEEQWYPPGYLVLCALIPEGWLERRYWLVNHLVDLVTLAILFWAAATFAPLWMAVGVAAIYALSPPLVQEYASLNTRPLGLVLSTAFLVAAYYGMSDPGWAVVACLLAVLLLYSHKLSAQQLWFTLPILALVTGDWRWIALLPLIYGLAFAVWPRGFGRIVAGHKAIVQFWHRQWRMLGAHMVRQSPVYGDGATRTDVYANGGLTGAVAFAKDTLHQNYFILPLLAAVALRLPRDAWEVFLLGWIVSVYAAASSIHFIRLLRGIGLGRQYVKFALVPVLLYLAAAAPAVGHFVVWSLIGLAAVLTIRQYVLVARQMQRVEDGQVGVVSDDLAAVLDRLKNDPGARVMCLPVHLCDLVAYATGRPTYWGTHSHCFDGRLAAFFPVLRRTLGAYAGEAGLTHLLLARTYAEPAELHLDDADLVASHGQYSLFRLHGRSGIVSAPKSLAAARSG